MESTEAPQSSLPARANPTSLFVSQVMDIPLRRCPLPQYLLHLLAFGEFVDEFVEVADLLH